MRSSTLSLLQAPASRFNAIARHSRPTALKAHSAVRPLSTSAHKGTPAAAADNAEEPATTPSNPRWLSELRSRIGKCIHFGLKPHQAQAAGQLLRELAQDWRELVGGSEGFLTGPQRRGLYRHEVAWGDMYGHVNNVVYNRYAESARVNWTQNFAKYIDPAHAREWSELCTSRGVGLILRSIKTDFKFPMKWPDRVTVLHKLRDRPSHDTDYFTLDVLVLSEAHQRPAARCVEDVVVYDYLKARKTPLLPFMVDKFCETFDEQERTKERYAERVRCLTSSVKELEKGSWDCEGAVEDFGQLSPSR